MNETLASILVTNIIKNAFVHSPEGGTVALTLTGNELVVANSGDSPLDQSRIFDRVYQGAKNDASTGLGLALAKTIADRNGLRLTYSYENGMHLFRIGF